MVVVSSDTPRMIEGEIRPIFFGAFDRRDASALYREVATIVPSTKAEEKYGWLGGLPFMREWTDERVPGGLKEFGYSIENKDWEVSMAVDRNALEDDQFGQIRLRTQQLGESASEHRDHFTFMFLLQGFNAVWTDAECPMTPFLPEWEGRSVTCFDGQNFFDSDHQYGDSPVQSNVTDAKLSAAALKAGRLAMAQFKDDKGRIMAVVPDTLFHGPQLSDTVDDILHKATLANNETNLLYNKYRAVEIPWWGTSTAWVLACTRRLLKPVIFQARQEVRFGSLEANSTDGFMRKKFVYGADARYNLGWGPWQMAYGSTGTAQGS